ncbi:hypothetical protein CBR_g23319 [Chara braunii]|uniref:Reverse transcriptase/retrotransposon-derived protein RNase H-like domain-containing protein n=1 Tax=Chara braunii TaxID=69332 RepID=A0A388L421_CHABU|nr:hypothetical protein CBR_g23319 [Chara braunii]|eukprot:GBG76988.1 hypothetical protein CBR_g23319 [Chara braunii]
MEGEGAYLPTEGGEVRTRESRTNSPDRKMCIDGGNELDKLKRVLWEMDNRTKETEGRFSRNDGWRKEVLNRARVARFADTDDLQKMKKHEDKSLVAFARRWKLREEIDPKRPDGREVELTKELEALKAVVQKLQAGQRRDETPNRPNLRPETRERGDPSPKQTWNDKACIYYGEEDHRKKDCQTMIDAFKEGIIELDDRKYVMWADEGKPVPFLPSMKINVDVRRKRMKEAKGKQAQIPTPAKVSRVTFEDELDDGPDSPGMRVSSVKFEEDINNDEVRVCAQHTGESSGGKKEDSDQPMTDEQVESFGSPVSLRKRGPKKFHLKSTLDEVDLRASLRRAMDMPIPIPLKEFIAGCGPARDELVAMMRKAKVSLTESAKANASSLSTEKEKEEKGGKEDYFYVLGSEKLKVIVNGVGMEAIVDDGSESTVCEDKVARRLGLDIDRSVAMTMISANKLRQPALGVCHKAKVIVAGVEVTVPVFTVENCSLELILGRTWLTHVNATTENKRDGSQTVTINGPDGSRVTLKTVNEYDKHHKVSLPNKGLLKTRSCQMIPKKLTLDPLTIKDKRLEVEELEDSLTKSDGRVMGELILNLVEVFLDDFPIKGPYEKDETEVRPGVRKFVATHAEDIKMVLVQLEDASLTVSGTKSRWAVSSIKILGYICDRDGRRPDSAKLEKLMNWPTPLRHIIDIRQFLGMVGLWKNLIKGYAGKAEPLRRLLRKGVEWRWTSEQEDVVKALNDEFKEGDQVLGVLYFEDKEKRSFVVCTDAGSASVGGV